MDEIRFVADGSMARGGFVSHSRIINKILRTRIAVKCFLV